MRKIIKNRVPVSIGIPYDLLLILNNIVDEQNISRSDYFVHLLTQDLTKRGQIVEI